MKYNYKKYSQKWQKNHRNKYLSYQKWYNNTIRNRQKLGNLNTEIIYNEKNQDKLETIIHKEAELLRKYEKNHQHEPTKNKQDVNNLEEDVNENL